MNNEEKVIKLLKDISWKLSVLTVALGAILGAILNK